MAEHEVGIRLSLKERRETAAGLAESERGIEQVGDAAPAAHAESRRETAAEEVEVNDDGAEPGEGVGRAEGLDERGLAVGRLGRGADDDLALVVVVSADAVERVSEVVDADGGDAFGVGDRETEELTGLGRIELKRGLGIDAATREDQLTGIVRGAPAQPGHVYSDLQELKNYVMAQMLVRICSIF